MVTAQSRLLVRADAGPNIGTGHVMRTLALGQAWKQRGGSVTFVCGHLPRGLIKRIEAEDFQLFQIKNDHSDAADARETADIASVVQPDWLVVDGYGFDDVYQRAVIAPQRKLLVVDDFGHAAHHFADLVLNQNVYASPRQYPDSCRGKILAGPQYILLRNEFGHRKYKNAAEPKRIAREACRILVSFGGADPDNWTLKSLQVLSELKHKRLIVDCVVGACYPHAAELDKFKKSANMSLRTHRNVDRMSQLMSRVDLAVTAGGSTCYELAHCGVPAIVASIAENQFAISNAMNERGIMISIDEPSSAHAASAEKCFNEKRLKRAIGGLINNPGQRKVMSDQGQRLVDGNGAQRIARTMAAGSFTLRMATMEDSDVMWHWRNDPEVRSVSFDDSPIPFDSFRRKLRSQLNQPQSQVWIAEDSHGQRIGQIQFEETDNADSSVISVILDQTRRGKGLGTLLISRACEEFFKLSDSETVVAQIKPGNVASEKAFRAAGFCGIQPAIVNGKMALQSVLDRTSDGRTSRLAAAGKNRRSA